MARNSTTPALIAVDWGTTNFRAYLLDGDGNGLETVSSSEGLLNVKGSFSETLERHIGAWLQAESTPPVLMGGMVGSRGGWAEVPYLECPISAEKLAAALYRLESFPAGNAWIVPGVSTRSACGHFDVMRGEEVQIIGALALIDQAGEQRPDYFCLPGTHSKWAPLSADSVSSFSTAMTGELYSLLGRQSILSQSIDLDAEWDERAFVSGLETSSRSGGLLHQLFSVRSRYLNDELDKAEGAAYLSGLLIGAEIRSMLEPAHCSGTSKQNLPARDRLRISVIASPQVASRYLSALQYFEIEANAISSESASLAGMSAVARCAGLIRVRGEVQV